MLCIVEEGGGGGDTSETCLKINDIPGTLAVTGSAKL